MDADCCCCLRYHLVRKALPQFRVMYADDQICASNGERTGSLASDSR
jgi:hypothetical protein